MVDNAPRSCQRQSRTRQIGGLQCDHQLSSYVLIHYAKEHDIVRHIFGIVLVDSHLLVADDRGPHSSPAPLHEFRQRKELAFDQHVWPAVEVC